MSDTGIDEAEAAGDTKLCPLCAETIKAAAVRCKHCHAALPRPAPPPAPPSARRTALVITGWLAFGFACLVGLYLVVLGALSATRRTPEQAKACMTECMVKAAVDPDMNAKQCAGISDPAAYRECVQDPAAAVVAGCARRCGVR